MKVRLIAAFLFVVCASACSSDPSSPASDASVDKPDGSSVPDSAAPDSSVPPADAGARDAASSVCDVEPSREVEKVIGSPSWKMAELVAYAAPVGTSTDDVFSQTTNSVFGPSHGIDPVMNLTKALLAHPAPYNTEVETGIAKAGFTSKGCMKLSALAAPNGFVVSMNLVPSASAASGKSFESAVAGPVIAFTELAINADLYIDGLLVDPDFDSAFPRASVVYSDATIEGYAHLLLNFGENTSFAPLKAGKYEFRVKLSDKSGNTTSNALQFKVID